MLNHLGTQTIVTDRLILRRYALTDADDMFLNWVTDREVTRFWGWKPHNDIEETKSLLQVWIDEYGKEDYYHWVIILKEKSQAIGNIYLSEIDSDEETASIHYLVSRKYWNKGFATEACKAVIMLAFTEIGLNKIQTRHHVNNPASGKVLQKSGMRFTGVEQLHFPDCEDLNGDYCFYETIKNEWLRTVKHASISDHVDPK
jgi:RimJ/RimL family protein N-acetyltransferase